MKIGELWYDDGRTLVKKEVHDFNPTLRRNQAMRSAGMDRLDSESVVAANVPGKVLHLWAKKWGVKMNDPAFHDVVARELNDSNNAHFRVWEGKL